MYPQLTSSGEPLYEGVLSQVVFLENYDSSFWHEEAKEYLIEKMAEEENIDKKDVNWLCFYVYSDISYEFEKETGLLKLFGEGAMPNYIIGDLEWLAEWHDSFNNKILNIEIEEGITSIGSFSFCRCQNIKNLNLPNSIKKIKQSAFSVCSSLESINIPESVEIIEDTVFEECESLKEIRLPKGLKIISSDSFANCENLEKIYMSRNTKITDCMTYDIEDIENAESCNEFYDCDAEIIYID